MKISKKFNNFAYLTFLFINGLKKLFFLHFKLMITLLAYNMSYSKENNQKYQHFWKIIRYKNNKKLYIRTYIPKSIVKVLLIYIKNWIKMLKEAIKPLL